MADESQGESEKSFRFPKISLDANGSSAIIPDELVDVVVKPERGE